MAEIPPIAIPLPMNHDPAAPSPAILLSLDPDFTLSMETTSLLGSRAKLQDIPKIEQLILGRLRGWMVDNLVWPKVRVLKLPGLGNKGSVEDASDGEGEYVWVEGAAEGPSRVVQEPVGEADDDEGPISTLSPSPSPQPADLTPQFRHSPLVSLSAIPLQSNRHRSHSGSSRPTVPLISPQIPNRFFVTPPRVRHVPRPVSIKQEGHMNHTLPGGLPPSDRSTSSLRHLNDPFGSQSTQWRQNESLRSPDGSLSTEEQARWARAGGMTGVSMGLGTQVSSNAGYGIRERYKDAERLKYRGHALGD